MRMFIVEDDPDIREALINVMQAEGFAVDWAENGEQASYIARTNEYDIILLDLSLPAKDGLEICKDIRKIGKPVPIILLSILAKTETKVTLLNSGADDYITKPFAFQELVARVKSVLRRPPILEPDILEVGDLQVDIPRQRVARGGKKIYLTRKEFSLLEYLVRFRGRVVSRGMIIEHVWDGESNPFSNTIEAHILNIRKKVDTRRQKLIHTIPGRGYKLDITP